MKPSNDELKQARLKAGLTQLEAANLIFKTLRMYQYYESGGFEMDCALWELFKQKTKNTQ